jgi:hypothetical protein
VWGVSDVCLCASGVLMCGVRVMCYVSVCVVLMCWCGSDVLMCWVASDVLMCSCANDVLMALRWCASDARMCGVREMC